MYQKKTIMFFLLVVSFLSGCAALDLKVDTLPVSNDYGKLVQRVPGDECKYYTGEPNAEYYVLAKYIVQEMPQVLTGHSPQSMICYVYKNAVDKGADTVIVDDVSSKNVAGGYARTSAVVKLRGIRFKGELPSENITPDFTYKPGSILIGKTTKRQVLEIYGKPKSNQVVGKYEKLIFGYQADKSNYKLLLVMLDSVSGVVKEAEYKDSDGNYFDESDKLLASGDEAANENKPEQAIKLYEKSIANNPNNFRALSALAWELIDLNINIDRGIEYAQKAVDLFPDLPWSNGTLGVGYQKKGDLDKAEKYLAIAVDLWPIYAPHEKEAFQRDKARLDAIKLQLSHTK